ncbi:MAG: outer membrane protein assembly factor BamA, partial [Desulfonatronovibrio sp.]
MLLKNNHHLLTVVSFLFFWSVLIWILPGQTLAAERTAVMPFEINAPADLEYLETGLPTMLIDSLESKGLEVVDLDRIRSIISSEDITRLNIEESGKVALQAESRYAVYGSFSTVDESISLDARLVDAFGEKETVPFYVVKEGVINILPAVEELADKIYQELLKEDR